MLYRWAKLHTMTFSFGAAEAEVDGDRVHGGTDEHADAELCVVAYARRCPTASLFVASRKEIVSQRKQADSR